MGNGAYAVRPVLIKVPSGENLAEVIHREAARLGVTFNGGTHENPVLSYVPVEEAQRVLSDGTYRTDSSRLDFEPNQRAVEKQRISPKQVVEAIGFMEDRIPAGKAVAMYDPRQMHQMNNVALLYIIQGAPLDALVAVFAPADSNGRTR